MERGRRGREEEKESNALKGEYGFLQRWKAPQYTSQYENRKCREVNGRGVGEICMQVPYAFAGNIHVHSTDISAQGAHLPVIPFSR